MLVSMHTHYLLPDRLKLRHDRITRAPHVVTELIGVGAEGIPEGLRLQILYQFGPLIFLGILLFLVTIHDAQLMARCCGVAPVFSPVPGGAPLAAS